MKLYALYSSMKHKFTSNEEKAIFCAGKNTEPSQATSLIKKFMALSISKLKKNL